MRWLPSTGDYWKEALLSDIKTLIDKSGLRGHSKISIAGVMSYLKSLSAKKNHPSQDFSKTEVQTIDHLIQHFENNLESKFSKSELTQLLTFFESRSGQVFSRIFSEGLISHAFTSAFKDLSDQVLKSSSGDKDAK